MKEKDCFKDRMPCDCNRCLAGRLMERIESDIKKIKHYIYD